MNSRTDRFSVRSIDSELTNKATFRKTACASFYIGSVAKSSVRFSSEIWLYCVQRKQIIHRQTIEQTSRLAVLAVFPYRRKWSGKCSSFSVEKRAENGTKLFDWPDIFVMSKKITSYVKREAILMSYDKINARDKNTRGRGLSHFRISRHFPRVIVELLAGNVRRDVTF